MSESGVAKQVGRLLVSRAEATGDLDALANKLDALRADARRARTEDDVSRTGSRRRLWLDELELKVRGIFDEEAGKEAIAKIAARRRPLPTLGPRSVHQQSESLDRRLESDGECLESIKMQVAHGAEPEAESTAAQSSKPSIATKPVKRKTNTRRAKRDAGAWTAIRNLRPGKQGEVVLVQRFEPEYQKGVMKKVSKAQAEDARSFERLKREITILRDTRHPCVIRILDDGLDAEEPWLVTEWASLGTVQEHRATFQGDAWRTLRLARDVASGLALAHANGIVHRDVKPMNIFLHDLDRAVIGDFGIAHDEDEPTLTKTNERVAGWFLPPEAELGRVDNPAPTFDVYSLGKVIYYLLTGGHVAPREDFREPDNDMIHRLGRPELEEVNELLGRMIAKNVETRHQSMEQVVAAIDAALAALFGPSRTTRVCKRCHKANYGDFRVAFPPGSQPQIMPLKGGPNISFDAANAVARICPECGDAHLKLGNVTAFRAPSS
jgi:serine/threonine protein kinase